MAGKKYVSLWAYYQAKMLDEHQVVDYQLCKAKQSAVVLLHGTQRVSEARVKKI